MPCFRTRIILETLMPDIPQNHIILSSASAWYAASVCSTGRTHAAAVAVRSGRCGVCHILWISLLERDSQATHRTCQRKRYTQAPSLPQSIEVSECGAPGCGHSMTAPRICGAHVHARTRGGLALGVRFAVATFYKRSRLLFGL
jgi:hypothetical protein